MVKPFWFLQYMEYRHEATVNTMALAIEEAGVDVVEKYIPFGGMKYDFIPGNYYF